MKDGKAKGFAGKKQLKKRADKERFSGRRPDIAGMKNIFRECGLELTDEQLEKFWSFHQLLRARKDELDLTRIHGFESMVLKHYVDCAVVPGMTDLVEPLLDIGTGAGFPGIPMKIIRPNLHVILAEGRAKRLEFLEEACQLLELENVDIYPHKVSPKFDLPVRGIITRDFEAIEKTLERALSILDRGGRIFFMKGPGADSEIKDAMKKFGSDFRLVSDRAYTLGDTRNRRRLIEFEMISEGIGPREKRSMNEVKEVASSKNKHFKIWQKLLDGRGVRKHGLALISGSKQVAEILNDYPDRCRAVLGRDAGDRVENLPEGVQNYRLRPELFKELDIFGAGAPLLVVEVADFPEWTGQRYEGCTLLVPFQDPANVGAVIRSAAAFGVTRIVLLEEAAHPFHPKSLRAAGPAVYKIEFLNGPSIRKLDPDKIPIIALGLDGAELPGYDFPDSFFLAPGVEGPGLPDNLDKAEKLTIPMTPGLESLNAAAAATVALYEWRRSRNP